MESLAPLPEALPELPSHLHLVQVLDGGRTRLVVDARTGARALARPLTLSRAQAERRLAQLAQVPAGVLVLETELLEHAGRLWALRPWVEGAPLRALRQGLPPTRAVELTLAAAAAVEVLHHHGVCHGRLHAGNVLLDTGREVLWLVDALDTAPPVPAREVTAAPERLRGGAPSVRTDVFGLGTLLFELGAGRAPFAAAQPLEALRRALYEPAALRPDEEARLPTGVAQALRQALHREPLRRTASVARLRGALAPAAPGRFAPARAQPARATPSPLHSAPTPLAHTPVPTSRPLAHGVEPVGAASHPARAVTASATLRLGGGLSTARHTAQQLAVGALERWWLLGPWARRAVPVALGLLVVGVLAGLAVSRRGALEREVEGLLAARRYEAAVRRLEAARATGESRPDATVEKLLGDVRCAQGASDACLGHYRTALERSDRHADDARLRENALALLEREDRRGRVSAVLARVEGVEDTLREATRSDAYWRRWNAVRALEKRGAGDSVPYTHVYGLDLVHAGSCNTRRAALAQLAQLDDPEAVPYLEQARERGRRRLFGDGCLGDDLDRTLSALQAQR